MKLRFESNAGKNQSFNAAKQELAEILEENAIFDNQITEEVMQISTDWHNLMVSLNQFVSQATQRSEEFISFVADINKLAVEISNLKKSVEKEVDIDLPERDNQDYARRMIERRDILEVSLIMFLFNVIMVASMFSYIRYIDLCHFRHFSVNVRNSKRKEIRK